MGVPKTVIAGLKMGSLLLISSLSVSIVFAWVGVASFQDLALVWDTVLNIDSFLPLPKCFLFPHHQGIVLPNQNRCTRRRMSRISVW